MEEHEGRREPEPTLAPALLLVDDEERFADTLAFRLAAQGLPALVAYRGGEALAFLDRPELEVVLLDLNMPGLSGLDLLRQIKEKRPDIEVLLLTGEADFAVAAKGMRRGASDYLLKPVDFSALLESIDKARKRCREHRERLHAAEAGRLMALGALAAGVGHEINNPLQVIMQRSEFIQDLVESAAGGMPPDLGEIVAAAEVIQRQAVRAGRITCQLLELAHRSRVGQAITDLARLMEKVVDTQKERAAGLQALIRVDIAPDMGRLPFSAAELEPVFAHLLRNGLDSIEALRLAEDEKGTRRDEEKSRRIDISARIVDNTVRITFADNGEGIGPEQCGQIFDPFFSTRPIGQGTGLGLTVCHSIITTLRGQISLAPAQAGGAVFTVELPLPQSHGKEV